jgi:hypothetical protein
MGYAMYKKSNKTVTRKGKIKMNYQEFVLDIFKEDQNCMGLDLEEIEDIIQEVTFNQIEKYLTKQGYDLKEMYENDQHII